jgi:hypothetical protein
MTPAHPPDDDRHRLIASFDRDALPPAGPLPRGWADAAERLRAGLAATTPPLPPVNFADRVLTAALLDRATRQRRRLWIGGLALAAGLLLAVGLTLLTALPNQPAVALRPPDPAPAAEPTPSLNDAWTQASGAVVGLTRRAAEESALGDTLALLPTGPALPTVSGDAWSTDLEPAARTLAEVQAGAASTLEPMTRSATRAFDLLLRDWPLDTDPRGPS